MANDFNEWFRENENSDILMNKYAECIYDIEGKKPSFKEWCREYYNEE